MKNDYAFCEKSDISESPERINKDIAILKKAFPNALSVLPYLVKENDKGIDYFVITHGESTKYVDVKTREKGVSQYWNPSDRVDSNGMFIKEPELTLEIWSNKERREPGWTLDKEKVTDYVLYTFDPSDCQNAYIFPFKSLQETFVENYSEWVKTYRVGECTTEGKYTTVSCFVPVTVVYEAMAELARKKEKEKLYRLIVRGGNNL